MKLVLYGISCAGKDTFINIFLTEHSSFKHIYGSKRLSEISSEKYAADFRAKVRAYYEEGHTYRTTADRFKISTNTVGRILKE